MGKVRVLLIISFLVFAFTTKDANSQAKVAEPLRFETVGGTCPRVTKKNKVVCDTADDKSVKEYVDVSFPVTPSTTIKTKTKLCTKEQLDKLMKREASLSDRKIEKLKAESCTVFFENEKGSKSFLLLTELIKDEMSTEDMNLFGMVLLMHENEGELELTAHYEHGHSEGIDGYFLKSICDTDGDNKADIIFDRTRYLNPNEQLIFKNFGNDEFTGPEVIEGMPGCVDGC